ncbi:abortive infection family protein [Alkalicoccobacillus murimartini]|uniref:Abortive infection protein-like C-terminal domain-containing protein n=1 Tax=Alkalicoccobacillus murimartini TaxID=171685 RepID=A0ABT9YCI5_9BACI|nr:abortive infection family protein [Alkalicoccobacillus murimartini]MDQ0205231.1 hypothetical protein [Alkalicoccobacillus murimartini]
MNAIETLEVSKNNLKMAISEYFNNDADPFKETVKADSLFKDCRNIIKRLIPLKDSFSMPLFLRTSRSIEEAVNYLTSNLEYEENLYTINSHIILSFNEFIDYLEEEQIDVKIIHVECEVPKELTFIHILESISKCEDRINIADYSGAVTSAKTLVEGVCKEIINRFPEEIDKKKYDLPSLFTEVRKNLNLNPRDPHLDKSLKEVLTGLIKIVNGISEIRNMQGDSHIPKYKIDRHHALLVVNSAKTLVTFIFNTYEYQFEKGKLLKAD